MVREHVDQCPRFVQPQRSGPRPAIEEPGLRLWSGRRTDERDESAELHLRVVGAQVRVGDLPPSDGYLRFTDAPARRVEDARVRVEAGRNDRAGVLRERVKTLGDPFGRREVVDVLERHARHRTAAERD